MSSVERPIESGAGPRGLQQAGYGQLGYTTPQYVNVNLSRWLQAVLWSFATTVAAMLLTAVAVLTTFNNYLDEVDEPWTAFDRWQTAEDIFNIIFLVSLAVIIPVIVLLQVWSFKSHKATGWLWPRERKWSRGWSVGAWWIPLANFLLVPMVLTEIYKIASGPRDGQSTRNGWALGKSSTSLILWFVLSGVGIGLFYGGADLTNGDSFTVAEYRWGVALVMGGAALLVGAAILAIGFVRNVSRKLASYN